MYKNIFLFVTCAILMYMFTLSADFKEIAAGVAIFLFGMLSLEMGFKAFTGGALEKILAKTTDKLWKSVSFGVVSTTLMQSSSLVSVITISFLSAGLIGLAQGIGIIFGANIGTTTGAWLIAGFGLKVKISAYAMPMLVFGVMLIFQKSKSLKGFGYILVGLGFLFLGIHHMKEGFSNFKDTIDLASFQMTGLTGLFVYTGIGIFATVVMQSSHATLVLILTALGAGQVSYENALALAIGANIGTTITAILGSLTANMAGKRLAGAHLIFNSVTGIIAIAFINFIIVWVDAIAAFVGIAADDWTLKLAVFHTIFNSIGVIVHLPFVNQLVVFLEKMFREKGEGEIAQPQFLHEATLQTPDTALKAVTEEIRHLATNSFEIFAHGLNMHRTDISSSDKDMKQLVEESHADMEIDIDEIYQRRVKNVYSGIIDFSSRAQLNMEAHQIDELYHHKIAARDIVEAIKDMKHMQENMALYIKSDNIHMRNEYNKIRLHLASFLRKVVNVEEATSDEEIREKLDECRFAMEQDDIVANGTLDTLIRDGAITDQMASSLMNDSAYAYDIHKNLISAAETIFAVRHLAPTTEQVVSISDDVDIENVLKRNQENIANLLQKNKDDIEALLKSTKSADGGAAA